jgi:2-hydroxy-6-oxonona-2,4-dienedioate hydrolase
VHSLVLTGSSGLYESAMGDSFPRRGDYEYIKKKTEEVFYDPKVANKELVDEVFSIVNSREKVIRTVAISKSAIRHNMAEELKNFHMPVCLIWGANDKVTPPEVANKFHELLPQSELYWIDQCGHAAMMEKPAEFNAILEEWLSRHVQQPA